MFVPSYGFAGITKNSYTSLPLSLLLLRTLWGKKIFSRVFFRWKQCLSYAEVSHKTHCRTAFPDFTKHFYLHNDASDCAVGATFSQYDSSNNLHILACMSSNAKLNATIQRTWSPCVYHCGQAMETLPPWTQNQHSNGQLVFTLASHANSTLLTSSLLVIWNCWFRFVNQSHSRHHQHRHWRTHASINLLRHSNNLQHWLD